MTLAALCCNFLARVLHVLACRSSATVFYCISTALCCAFPPLFLCLFSTLTVLFPYFSCAYSLLFLYFSPYFSLLSPSLFLCFFSTFPYFFLYFSCAFPCFFWSLFRAIAPSPCRSRSRRACQSTQIPPLRRMLCKSGQPAEEIHTKNRMLFYVGFWHLRVAVCERALKRPLQKCPPNSEKKHSKNGKKATVCNSTSLEPYFSIELAYPSRTKSFDLLRAGHSFRAESVAVGVDCAAIMLHASVAFACENVLFP